MFIKFKDMIRVFFDYLFVAFGSKRQLVVIQNRKKSQKEMLKKQELDEWFNSAW